MWVDLSTDVTSSSGEVTSSEPPSSSDESPSETMEPNNRLRDETYLVVNEKPEGLQPLQQVEDASSSISTSTDSEHDTPSSKPQKRSIAQILRRFLCTGASRYILSGGPMPVRMEEHFEAF